MEICEIRYNKVDQIGVGEGLNSEVWLADEPQLGGRVAVKEISKASFGMDPDEYFREARLMFQTEHPNVVPIRYAGQTTDRVLLVMPFYKEGSLLARIRNSPLRLSEIRRVGQSILSGISRIHLAKVIHFDIKPSNILFSNAGEPMVADFGQARTYQPKTGAVQSPSMYLHAQPPEVLQTGVGIVASDLYQFGVLLYRATNGERFYSSQIPPDSQVTKEILSGRFPDRQQFLPHVPMRLRTVIRKLLQVKPAKRYSSAAEVSTALGRIPIDLDWQMRYSQPDGISWNATRDSRPTLLVDMISEGHLFCIQTFTESPAGKRALKKNEYWRQGLTREDSFKHLESVFTEMI